VDNKTVTKVFKDIKPPQTVQSQPTKHTHFVGESTISAQHTLPRIMSTNRIETIEIRDED